MIAFFAFFYTAIVFNPTETADNLKKHGGFIPGIRPGERTAEYIDYVLSRKNIPLADGRLTLNLSGNYTHKNERDGAVNNPAIVASAGQSVLDATQEALMFTSRPKFKTILGADWDYKQLNLSLNNTMFGPTRFRQAGIWTPDFSPLFDEKEEHAYYFKGDHHWTPHGARRSAKIVAETLKQVPGFEEIPKKQFESKRVGLLSKLGTFHKAAAQLCGNSYATQYVDRFETEPVGASDSGDLFGDGGGVSAFGDPAVRSPNSTFLRTVSTEQRELLEDDAPVKVRGR